MFLTIGVVGGEGGGGRHWRKQTKARKSCIVPMYPLHAHKFVYGHSLDVVQVEVLQAHQVVIVVDIDQVVIVVVVVIIIIIIVIIVSVISIVVALSSLLSERPRRLWQRRDDRR